MSSGLFLITVGMSAIVLAILQAHSCTGEVGSLLSRAYLPQPQSHSYSPASLINAHSAAAATPFITHHLTKTPVGACQCDCSQQAAGYQHQEQQIGSSQLLQGHQFLQQQPQQQHYEQQQQHYEQQQQQHYQQQHQYQEQQVGNFHFNQAEVALHQGNYLQQQQGQQHQQQHHHQIVHPSSYHHHGSAGGLHQQSSAAGLHQESSASGHQATSHQTVYQQTGGEEHQIVAHHGADEDGGHKKDHDAYYKFEYAVNDHKTGDIKQQKEERKGDVVNGEYSLVEEGGNVRTVKYYADWKTGFHAQVHNSKAKQ